MKRIKINSETKNKIYKIGLILIFLWFLIQTVYIAITIDRDITPDEIYHYKLIQIYRNKKGISPTLSMKEQEKNYDLRDITRYSSYLYHYITGNILKATNLTDTRQTIVALRFFNILLNSITLYIIFKILNEITNNKAVKILTLFMFTNTLMYVFLSPSINYDNLLNLLGTLSIFLLIKFIKNKQIIYLALLLITAFLAMLTKYTAGPLLLIEFIILSIEIYKYIKKESIKKLYKKYFNEIKKIPIKFKLIIIILLIISGNLFIERYGINLIKYKTIKSPECTQLHSTSQCLKNGIFLRNYTLKKQADKDPSKRDFTFIDFSKKWLKIALLRTYGIITLKRMHPNPSIIFSITGISIVAFLYNIMYFNLHKKKLNLYIFIITIFYTLVLIIYNYQQQKKYGSLGLAVQGRYLFPIFPFFYYFINNSIIRGFNKFNDKMQKSFNFKYINKIFLIFYASIVIIVFITGCFPWYLMRANKTWYINQKRPQFINKLFPFQIYDQNNYQLDIDQSIFNKTINE